MPEHSHEETFAGADAGPTILKFPAGLAETRHDTDKRIPTHTPKPLYKNAFPRGDAGSTILEALVRLAGASDDIAWRCARRDYVALEWGIDAGASAADDGEHAPAYESHAATMLRRLEEWADTVSRDRAAVPGEGDGPLTLVRMGMVLHHLADVESPPRCGPRSKAPRNKVCLV